MGSFPYPPNGIVEVDYEFILLFKKPERDTGRGTRDAVPQVAKEASKLTRDEWKEFFSGHWEFAGERQTLHEAMFPEELPRRLIRMFSFVGETVLDPFLGSGTTVKVALELGRSAIGYEIQPEFEPLIRQKLGISENALIPLPVTIVRREKPLPPVEPPAGYMPRVKDAKPLVDLKQLKFGEEVTYKVVAIVDERTLQMDNGLVIQLLGISVPPERRQQAITYLQRFVLGKRVLLRFDRPPEQNGAPVPAYLYLTNRLFVNRKMIEMGLANADRTVWHRYRESFLQAEAERNG